MPDSAEGGTCFKFISYQYYFPNLLSATVMDPVKYTIQEIRIVLKCNSTNEMLYSKPEILAIIPNMRGDSVPEKDGIYLKKFN